MLGPRTQRVAIVNRFPSRHDAGVLNALQSDYKLRRARRSVAAEIDREVSPRIA